jgi:hypothetical protein
MPFPEQPWQPFTRESVESIDPGQLGCYGLFSGGLCVYIGKGDIRARLLDHLNGDNACIALARPSHWKAVVTADMDALEKSLTLEYSPRCNERVG